MQKILVVEDETLLLTELQERLMTEGYQVLTAKDGQEGLDIALKEHPSLILLDIVMPIMDGLTMLYELRKDEWGKGVTVILLTNLNEDDKIVKSYSEGVHDYLVKADWSLDEVVNKVNSKLQ